MSDCNKSFSGSRIRVGWVVSERYLQRRWSILRPFGFYTYFGRLAASTRMRVANVSRWINSNTCDIWCELYDARRHYDVVVIVKTVSEPVQALVRHLKENGTNIIYDANVNYWEVWGEYNAASPRPTALQQQGVHYLTRMADVVVAASSYLEGVAKKYASQVVWIPDNVDVSVYSKIRDHIQVPKLRLVWSGMSHKAEHLTMLTPVLERLNDKIDLVIVSEKRPVVLNQLPSNLNIEYYEFSDKRYADLLSTCDVIISPKNLANAYDLGHTEYKITLGMAAGLPAVASPQQSYIDAISYLQGGFVVAHPADWLATLQRLHADATLRSEVGKRARQTVLDKYSTEVIASQYACIIRRLRQE